MTQPAYRHNINCRGYEVSNDGMIYRSWIENENLSKKTCSTVLDSNQGLSEYKTEVITCSHDVQ
jgi:hypothetical protein